MSSSSFTKRLSGFRIFFPGETGEAVGKAARMSRQTQLLTSYLYPPAHAGD